LTPNPNRSSLSISKQTGANARRFNMWETKLFKTLDSMNKWIDKNQNRFQIVPIFVDNAYGIEYKKLHRVY